MCMNVRNSIFMLQLRLIIKVGLCYTTYKSGKKRLNQKKINKRYPKCAVPLPGYHHMLSNLKVLVTEISFVKICYRLNHSDSLQNILKQCLMSFSIGYRSMKHLVRKRKQVLKPENQPKQNQQVANYEREGKKEEATTEI